MQVVATEMDWDIKQLPSAEGPCEPGCWLDAEVRLDELQQAWSADVLWAMRGGYGCIHLAQEIEKIARIPPPCSSVIPT